MVYILQIYTKSGDFYINLYRNNTTMKIDDWTISGAGMEGEEFRQNQLLIQMGINTPKGCELTQWNGHPAIVFQKITNKESFCKVSMVQTRRHTKRPLFLSDPRLMTII